MGGGGRQRETHSNAFNLLQTIDCFLFFLFWFCFFCTPFFLFCCREQQNQHKLETIINMSALSADCYIHALVCMCVLGWALEAANARKANKKRKRARQTNSTKQSIQQQQHQLLTDKWAAKLQKNKNRKRKRKRKQN